MAHDSADRASGEAATAWACSSHAHKVRGAGRSPSASKAALRETPPDGGHQPENSRTHQRAPQSRGGAVSCRAWRLPTELCGLRATRRRFVSQGCSENPSKRGLRNPITAAIVQSKNRCSEYAGLRNSFLSQEGPSRVLSLVFKRRKNSRVANWLGVCHPCTSLSSRHTTR
jgi:hypothetical protein